MLSHRAALTFVDWAVARFRVSVEDRLSSHAPLHFDLSIFDVFAASHAGAAVVLVPPVDAMFPRLVARFIADNEITVWYSVPTALSALVTKGGLAQGAFPKLRTILFAGEVFPTRYLRQLMGLLPHVSFYNLYGPAETNVCTYHEVASPPASDTEPIPIGRAISNVDVFALTEDGKVAGRRRQRRALRAWANRDAGILGRSRADQAGARARPTRQLTNGIPDGRPCPADGGRQLPLPRARATPRSRAAGTGSSWERSRQRSTPTPQSWSAPSLPFPTTW